MQKRFQIQGAITFPGKLIASSNDFDPGQGTYLDHKSNSIYASRKGKAFIVSSIEEGIKPRISIDREEMGRSNQGQLQECKQQDFYTFKQGRIVIGKVELISRNAIHVKILGTKGKEQSGKINLMFMKQHQSGKIRVEDCFIPGDKIRARIIGKQKRSWILATNQPQLGVILAKSKITDQIMIPINWDYFLCPVSRVKQRRKVAKVDFVS